MKYYCTAVAHKLTFASTPTSKNSDVEQGTRKAAITINKRLKTTIVYYFRTSHMDLTSFTK